MWGGLTGLDRLVPVGLVRQDVAHEEEPVVHKDTFDVLVQVQGVDLKVVR